MIIIGAAAVAIVAILFFMNNRVAGFLKDLYLMKYLPELKPDSSYALILLVGILTSFHCIGMCGGIALSQGIVGAGSSTADSRIGSTSNRKGWFKPSLIYNMGRVISYTLIGGLAGGLGYAVQLSGVWKGAIPIIGGLFMVIMGLNLLGLFPFLRFLNPRMPKFLTKNMVEGKYHGSLIIGLLSGLLPCAPLQAVQLYSLSTGSIVRGAMTMFLFSVGTVPLLFAFGVANSFISHRFTQVILKISAVLVIALGIGMFGRGLAAAGVAVDLNPLEAVPKEGIAVIADDYSYQTVVMNVLPDKFAPIVVQKYIPVNWTIKVTKENLNECNDAIVIPKYGIRKDLEPGDNLVQFTPTNSGVVPYTCWMVMIKSKIIVVDDISKANVKVK
jgi:sulfite exporter TauE/SafE